jgi:hypothetical protein
MCVRGCVHVENHLHEAREVSQVDERKTAVIAASVHPAGEGDNFAGVCLARLAAGHVSIHLAIPRDWPENI